MQLQKAFLIIQLVRVNKTNSLFIHRWSNNSLFTTQFSNSVIISIHFYLYYPQYILEKVYRFKLNIQIRLIYSVSKIDRSNLQCILFILLQTNPFIICLQSSPKLASFLSRRLTIITQKEVLFPQHLSRHSFVNNKLNLL